MILPNKLIPFKKSTLYKTIFILNELSVQNFPISGLFTQVSEYFEDINEYIIALDVLFVLNCISYDEQSGVIKYVREN